MADDQPTYPVPWWAAGGPARITVHPYQPAAAQPGDSAGWAPWAPGRDAWFPDDWAPVSAPADAPDSDDQNAAAAPVPTDSTDPTDIAPRTRYLDPFTQFLIASLARAPATTQQPLVSPALSNALAWGVPIFPKDILGFDPNKIPASQWPTTPPIFLHGRLGSSPVNPPPSPWPFSSASAQGGDQSSFVPDMGGAATHSLLARIAPAQAASSALPAPGTYPGLFPPPPSIAASGGVLPIGPDRSLGTDDLDAAARALAAPNLPVSKSTGTPFVPPPVQPALSGAQWREAAKDVGSIFAPGLTDYLTKPAPSPVYSSAPGKIPSPDFNPYAAGAVWDATQLALTLLGPEFAPAIAERLGGLTPRLLTSLVARATSKAIDEGGSAAAERGLSAAEQLSAKRARQLRVNVAAGARIDDKTNLGFDRQRVDVGRQLTVETPTSSRTRVDFVTRTRETGEINCIECKGSDTARVSPKQREAHADIQRCGATIVGRGKPGFPGGMKIPPTSVEIRRPRK